MSCEHKTSARTGYGLERLRFFSVMICIGCQEQRRVRVFVYHEIIDSGIEKSRNTKSAYAFPLDQTLKVKIYFRFVFLYVSIKTCTLMHYVARLFIRTKHFRLDSGHRSEVKSCDDLRFKSSSYIYFS